MSTRWLSLRPDHLRGDEQVGAGAAAEVEHNLAWLDAPELPVVRDTGEALDTRLGHAGELRFGIAELLGPGAPGGEDEVLVRAGGDLGVGLLDLVAQDVDVDRGFGAGGRGAHYVPF